MADTEKGSQKSLEMRVAELEDKLRSVSVTEDEMKAFHKVSALMGGGGQAAAAAPAPGNVGLTPYNCIVYQCTVVSQCTIRPCTIRPCTIINPCTIRQCTIISDCINECGGGLPGAGGGFGGFGG
jgi:hypothetical protein